MLLSIILTCAHVYSEARHQICSQSYLILTTIIKLDKNVIRMQYKLDKSISLITNRSGQSFVQLFAFNYKLTKKHFHINRYIRYSSEGKGLSLLVALQILVFLLLYILST